MNELKKLWTETEGAAKKSITLLISILTSINVFVKLPKILASYISDKTDMINKEMLNLIIKSLKWLFEFVLQKNPPEDLYKIFTPTEIQVLNQGMMTKIKTQVEELRNINGGDLIS